MLGWDDLLAEPYLPGSMARMTMHTPTVDEPKVEGEYVSDDPKPVAVEKANLITSKLWNGKHAPVLDLDVPHTLIPSTTPGHSHLYLDVELSWWRYKRLLKQLSLAGIIEPGYYRASKRRGFTAVRLPWVKKVGR